MSRLAAIALSICVAAAAQPLWADDASSPHHMANKDGSLDMQKCGVCHSEDLSLLQPKLETCTLCHAQTSHAGSNNHLRADPQAVKAALATDAPKGGPAFPLTDDGHMYCGTCHLFHDPSFEGEAWLATGWLPPDKGVSAAVKQGVLDRWAKLAADDGAKDPLGHFAAKGTRQLRLPVDDGQLCRRCHGALR